jgi:amino acid transporter
MNPGRMTRGARRILSPRRAAGTLGTFGGVFTPSILTILGIILFLRLGYVVGSVGLGRALLIIGIATAVVALTSVSLSAIATNMKMQGGGDYYLISRTLGVEFGGAVGIVLFFAEAISVALYAIGFGEAVCDLVGWHGPVPTRGVAFLAGALLFFFAWLGADWATRFQYVVMTVLAAALASFFVGGAARFEPALAAANWAVPAGALSFWVAFAIFFPAVTGFTQGVNMSGDLKDPGRSIPRGTFAAVALSAAVYVAAAVVLAGALSGDVLRTDYAAMRRLARHTAFVDAGVMAGALSSGLASFLGAPRILQSMGRDRIFPFVAPFARGVGPADNPRRAVLLAACVAAAMIVTGSLNLIARVVSMFFLALYGIINYATFSEARAASPSFRPRLRWYDARLSLAGGLGCLGVILAIDPAAGVVAVALLLAIYEYLKRTAGPARWADGTRSYHFRRVRDHLHAMAADPEHPRDWRPQLLVFSNESPRRGQLLRFASWIEGGSGLTTVVQIVEGGGAAAHRRRQEAREVLHRDIEQAGVEAFPLVVEGPHLGTTAHVLLQAFGLGPIHANTILLNWLEQVPTRAAVRDARRYGAYLRTSIRLGCNVIVLAADEERWTRLEAIPLRERRIDVCWRDDATSRLEILLAYLMTRSDDWREATIRLIASGGPGETTEAAHERLRHMLDEIRIQAHVEVRSELDLATLAAMVTETALVFLPMRLRGDLPLDPFGALLAQTLEELPAAALVAAAEDVSLGVEPDEGAAATMAAAADAAADAEARARAAEEAAARVAREAEEARRQLETEGGAMQETAEKAAVAASEAARHAAKARAKADEAAREAVELGARPPASEEDSVAGGSGKREAHGATDEDEKEE